MRLRGKLNIAVVKNYVRANALENDIFHGVADANGTGMYNLQGVQE